MKKYLILIVTLLLITGCADKLEEKGFSKDEITYIKENLNDDEINKLLELDYDKNTINILKEDKAQMDEELKKLDENWNKMQDKLAYYIEHDELEKVDTAIVDAKSFVETEDYPSAVSEIDKAKFVMEHIKRKYAFNLQNIF